MKFYPYPGYLKSIFTVSQAIPGKFPHTSNPPRNNFWAHPGPRKGYRNLIFEHIQTIPNDLSPTFVLVNFRTQPDYLEVNFWTYSLKWYGLENGNILLQQFYLDVDTDPVKSMRLRYNITFSYINKNVDLIPKKPNYE